MMVTPHVSGTEGYAEAADFLINKWQAISFADQHAPVMHLIPATPCKILDVGAGIGTDAAALAAMGHQVVAVEPTNEFRAAGIALHDSHHIEWLDDSLPGLSMVCSRNERFDLIILSAVWMHLDEQQREQAMSRLASLLNESGLIIMSLRHGPVPHGRRMFEVSAVETIRLAVAAGLETILNVQTESIQEANQHSNVMWTRLGFRKFSG